MLYRSEIDGLRALAVIPVIFFHAGLSFFNGGFVGVDIFYVISGYLISGIILKETEVGNFSLINFYQRRARRLLPSLFFVLGMTIPLAFIFLVPIDLKDYLTSLAAVSTFSSNIYFLLGMEGYFSESAELKPLLHTWSLAVEEQYYLLFPLFILLTWRFGLKIIISLLMGVFLISLSLSYWGASAFPTASFYLLPTRGWELLMGVFAALYLKSNPRPFSKSVQNFMGLVGLILIVFAIVNYNYSTPYPGLYALIPTIGTVLIILYVRTEGIVKKILSGKILVSIGLISYSAYLWHVPLFAFARNANFNMLPIEVASLLIILTFLLAYLTWKYIENPFRDKSKFSSRSIWSFSIVGSLFFIIFGLGSAYKIKDIELKMATDLSKSSQIINGNIDERLFIKYRIMLENHNPQMIVIGSSRMMQVSKDIAKVDILNLSVSDASLEDGIAITGLAMQKYQPETIVIGLDPWLLNKNSTRDRWRSLEDEYNNEIQKLQNEEKYSEQKIDFNNEIDKSSLESESGQSSSFMKIRNFTSPNDLPKTYKDMTRSDGSRIYNTIFQNKPEEEIKREFTAYIYHSINNYKLSNNLKSQLQSLVDHYSDSTNILLMLMPYHPELFKRFISEEPILLEIEKDFRNFAKKNNLRIIGSYNPNKTNCFAEEFYDGIHPEGSCINKIFHDESK